MSSTVLVAFATRYGSTREVADAVARGLTMEGVEASVAPVQQVRSLEGCSAVVLGTALYLGSMDGAATAFLERFRVELGTLPCALFALGPIAAAVESDDAATGQLRPSLARLPWFTPVDIAVFGGKYDPSRLRLPDRLLTALPASPLHGLLASDRRDWKAIDAWARALARRLAVRRAAV